MARPAVLVTSGVLSANEARELAEDWERAYSAYAPLRDITKPVPPQGRFVIDFPWPFQEAIDWLKGLFK